MPLYRYIKPMLVAPVDFFCGRELYRRNLIACVRVCVCVCVCVFCFIFDVFYNCLCVCMFCFFDVFYVIDRWLLTMVALVPWEAYINFQGGSNVFYNACPNVFYNTFFINFEINVFSPIVWLSVLKYCLRYYCV